MDNKDNRKSIIANALIWASMMLATSLLLDNRDQTQFIVMILMLGWLGTNSLFVGRKMQQAECAYFRKLFGREKRPS